MLDKQFKLEGKIRNVSVLNRIKILGPSLKANLTLKIKVKVSIFQNSKRHLDDQ